MIVNYVDSKVDSAEMAYDSQVYKFISYIARLLKTPGNRIIETQSRSVR